MNDGDALPDGPRIEDVAAIPDQIIHFYCLGCDRRVDKDGPELMQSCAGHVRIWTLARKLRCIECGHLGFTLRLGFKSSAKNVPRNVY